MHTLPLSRITIPQNRQRSDIEPEALGELAASITAIGLLHPPVVRREGEDYFLVAGERRLSAIRLLAATGQGFSYAGQLIPAGSAPVNLLGELSPLEAMEAELEENIRRVDLSMPDRVKAIAQLHELRQKQAAARGEDQTPRQTGEEAFPEMHPKAAAAKAREAILIANNLHIPEVARAKTEREAMKVISRAAEREQNQRLASIIGEQAATELHQVYHADCADWLETYSGPRFDCILIDPPYGMDAESFGDAANRLAGIQHHYADTPASFRELMGTVAPLLGKVAAAGAHLYIWCDIDGFHFLRELFRGEGWYVFRTPLINVKREGGRVPLPEHGPRRAYELCLYAFRGGKPVTAIYPDVFESTLEGGNLGHGAQKPVEAYVNLLKRSCRPGDRVLDCFAGTGTILPAAHELKLRATAVERDAGSYGICLKRLEGLK
jgi:16S rRNA G966 N2-methylase RsmD